MERANCGFGFEEALRLCHEVLKAFRGSRETLEHIKRVEECLRRLIEETN